MGFLDDVKGRLHLHPQTDLEKSKARVEQNYREVQARVSRSEKISQEAKEEQAYKEERGKYGVELAKLRARREFEEKRRQAERPQQGGGFDFMGGSFLGSQVFAGGRRLPLGKRAKKARHSKPEKPYDFLGSPGGRL